jgi:hypothetical protein
VARRGATVSVYADGYKTVRELSINYSPTQVIHKFGVPDTRSGTLAFLAFQQKSVGVHPPMQMEGARALGEGLRPISHPLMQKFRAESLCMLRLACAV